MPLLCVSSLVALGLAGAVLRQIEKSSFGERAMAEETLLTDAALRQRLKPFALGHDAKGFRNDSVPRRAEEYCNQERAFTCGHALMSAVASDGLGRRGW